MSKKYPLTLIIPKIGDPDEWKTTLKSIEPLYPEVQVITELDISGQIQTDVVTRLQSGETGTMGDLINRALPLIEAEYLAVLSPQSEISPQLIAIVRKCRDKYPDASYLYGNYYQRDENGDPVLQHANPCPDDITEREDWGMLEIYNTEALESIGGCDPAIRFRSDYDLRLRLTVERPACRIEEPLCTIPYQPPDQEPGAEALFFPGRGKLGGFSYLFMDPAEEQEIEQIFYRALRQRDAYLEHPPKGRFPKPAASSPRISVVLPVHDRAGFLPLAVASVQRGTFQDFEIIIVDNASQDDTLQVARDLAAKDSRITVISLPDNVIAKALNTGIRQARGDYICQLDSDDEYTENTLEVMVRTLDENLNWALAISYYDLMDEAGNTLVEFGVIKHLEYNRNNILRVDGAGAVRCWRKAAIDELGGFNETDFGHYGEDYDLVLKAGEKWEVGRVHQVLYHYRRHPGNSDVLRSHDLKIKNKTLARMRAIQRRQQINRQSP